MRNYEDFLKCNQIRKLDNNDLMKYKQDLEDTARALQDHMKELKEVWDYVKATLQNRVEDLIWDELLAEQTRLQEHYTVDEEASFKIH